MDHVLETDTSLFILLIIFIIIKNHFLFNFFSSFNVSIISVPTMVFLLSMLYEKYFFFYGSCKIILNFNQIAYPLLPP
jgi:uncharacterized membrane protein